MNRPSLIRKVNKGIKDVLGNRTGSKDFQRNKVYNLHDKIPEDIISEHECHKIVRRLDSQWNIYTTDLYPETCIYGEKDCVFAEGWPLNKRHAAIQIPRIMATKSITAHEHAHGVLECFLHNDKTSIKDPGHGPLWAGIFAWNLSKVLKRDYSEVKDVLEQFKVLVIDEDTILTFRKLFMQ